MFDITRLEYSLITNILIYCNDLKKYMNGYSLGIYTKELISLLLCNKTYYDFFYNTFLNNYIKYRYKRKKIRLNYIRCNDLYFKSLILYHICNNNINKPVFGQYSIKDFDFPYDKKYEKFKKSQKKFEKSIYTKKKFNIIFKRCNTKTCMNYTDINDGFCLKCYSKNKYDSLHVVCINNFRNCKKISNDKTFCKECQSKKFVLRPPIFNFINTID